MTENLLTYGLCREIVADDMPTVRLIMRNAAARGYRLSDLIEAVTTSTPFTMRVRAVDADATRVAVRTN